MSKYLVLFSLGYAVLVGVCSLLSRFVPLGPAGSVVGLIGGACFAMAWFLKDRQRRPTSQEMRTLVVGSTLVSLLVSAVLIAAFLWIFSEPEQRAFMLDAARAQGGLAWGLGLLVVCAVSLLVLWLSYAGYARLRAKKDAAGTA